MPFQVLSTPIAATQSAGLRGPNKKALEAFLDDLAQRGCSALGYRLTGDVVERLCVKHLRGPWRAVVGFTGEETVWLPLVAPHNREPETDVYRTLFALAGHEPQPDEARTEPPCCGEESGRPPEFDEALIDEWVDRSRQLTRRPRRR